jgi:hypothetical protein
MKEKIKKKRDSLPPKLIEEKEGEPPKKSVRKKENLQLVWILVVVMVVFAAFLIPYFYIENSKTFEFGGIDWQVEKFGIHDVYHGRFIAISDKTLNYNVYFWIDPRENDVQTLGNFDEFRIGGYVSMDLEIGQCREEYNNAIDMRGILLNLGAFLETGVGIQQVEYATTDIEYATDTKTPLINCENTPDRSVVIVEKGDDSFVSQDENNSNCYRISVKGCKDILPVEKFIMETISAFREKE